MAARLARRVAGLASAAALLLGVGAAQAAGWEVGTLRAGKDARMPWVTGPDDAVADRIDTLLFLDVLEAAPPKNPKAGFVLPGRGQGATPVTPNGFTLLRQDARVLSLLVSAEGCGAYCEGFEKAFLFDLGTGRRVTEAELLTPQGAKELGRLGIQAFVAAIGKRIALLGKPKAQGLDDDDRDMLRSSYESCRTLYRDLGREGRLTGSIRVDAKGAELWFGRCTPHAIRALDELGDFGFRIEPQAWAAALAPYGRRLLLGEDDAAAPTGPLGQVFSGTVGGAAIRLATGPAEADGSFGGTYYYERYRKPIALTGRLQAGRWTLSETDADARARAEWSLQRQGSGWAGTWTGADGRRLPVTLTP